MILRSNTDIPLTINNRQPCSVLLEKLQKHTNLEGKKAVFCYSGKVLDMEQAVGSYIKEDGVVTVFIRKAA